MGAAPFSRRLSRTQTRQELILIEGAGVRIRGAVAWCLSQRLLCNQMQRSSVLPLVALGGVLNVVFEIGQFVSGELIVSCLQAAADRACRQSAPVRNKHPVS